MSEQVFNLPDVGEGLTEAEIVRWRVQVGDEVSVNDPIVDIETAKAVVELPCPFTGVIGELLVAEGQVVAVGTPILSVSSKSLLIGYGVMEDTATTKPASASTPVLADRPAATGGKALAKPPVRALARERGIDLALVTPTGPYGDVTRADLEAHHAGAAVPAASPAASPATSPASSPAASPATGGQRIAVRGVQRTMAATMVQSVTQIPQVTVWRDVEVSGMVRAMAALRADPDWADVRVTPMLFIASAMVHAARRSPMVNSSWRDLPDGSAEIELHAGVDLCLAVAGPRGLVVPHIAGIDRMTARDRASALTSITTRARDDLLTPAELVGGTITITNVGVFGVDGGTPIVIPGQSAILATGRIMERPWAISGGLTVRPVMTLALAFDHRVVDGATGSTFLTDVTDYLEQPPAPLI